MPFNRTFIYRAQNKLFAAVLHLQPRKYCYKHSRALQVSEYFGKQILWLIESQ